MRRTATLVIVLLGSLLIAAGGFSAGEEKKASPEKEKKEKAAAGSSAADTPPTLYTNEDLERMFGPPGRLPAKPAEPLEKGTAAGTQGSEPDPLKRMEDQQARDRTRRKLVLQAELDVKAAEKTVQQLEQRLLAIRNPYLPRPHLTPEEEKAWKDMDGAKRVEATEKELEKARNELDAAKARLAKLKSGN